MAASIVNTTLFVEIQTTDHNCEKSLESSTYVYTTYWLYRTIYTTVLFICRMRMNVK